MDPARDLASVPEREAHGFRLWRGFATSSKVAPSSRKPVSQRRPDSPMARRNKQCSSSGGAANLQQSRTPATLRETLLPKLLSGELSVARAVLSPATEQAFHPYGP